MSHIIDRGPKWKKQIRFTPPGSVAAVKLTAYKSMEQTRRLKDRMDALLTDRGNGDPPRPELLPWIQSMPAALSRRLVALGLLDRRKIEPGRLLYDEKSLRSFTQVQAAGIDAASIPHLDAFALAVRVRRSNTTEHARRTAACVLRVCKALKLERVNELSDMTVSDLEAKVAEWGNSKNTNRHYLVAMSNFCAWMKREKRVSRNPIEDLTLPSAEADPAYERRPLTVEEFRRLALYLAGDGKGLYPGQKAPWTGSDRRMLYWTAVCTGYRQNELRSLCGGQLFLDPPAIDIRARDAKNRTDGAVPIPVELAEALAKYVQERGIGPADRIFWMPSQRHSIVAMLRRDLSGANITATWETGEVVDFHSFRCTAITWWLDVYGLSSKRVQQLARLKTLRLVERYSRKFRLTDTSWLSQAPKLALEGPKKNKLGEVA